MKYSGIEETPLVSVVLPVYNREDTIARAINSVLNQSYTNVELIIVDDCSTDHSLRVAHEFQDDRVNVIALQQNVGANSARNKGAMEAQGQYIAFQDSDDEWFRDKLETQIRDMVDRKLTASFCAHYLIDGVGSTIIPKDYTDQEKYEAGLINVLVTRNVISTQTLVVRRDAFMAVGGFDEDMPRLQDHEFAIRLVQKEQIGYIARPLVSVYRTNESISTNMEALGKAVALLLVKHGAFLNRESVLSFFMKAEFTSRDGGCLYEDLTQLQNILEENHVTDINILKYAVEYAAEQNCLRNRVQCRLYENQLNRLESDHFVIFGAGNVAQIIYSELGNKGIYPKCFLVTGPKEREIIDKTPVYTMDEWEDVDIEVVVGVALTWQNEIIDGLLKRNYRHIICYPYL